MAGILLSIISGICMTLQGIFNTRASEKISTLQTNVLVQGSGFLLTVIILLAFGKCDFKGIKDINKLYLTGGILGVIIIFTVMQGIKSLGATCSIITILIAQLLSAAIIDAFGLFGTTQINFSFTKIIGVVLMLIGVIIFKWKCH